MYVCNGSMCLVGCKKLRFYDVKLLHRWLILYLRKTCLSAEIFYSGLTTGLTSLLLFVCKFDHFSSLLQCMNVYSTIYC